MRKVRAVKKGTVKKVLKGYLRKKQGVKKAKTSRYA